MTNLAHDHVEVWLRRQLALEARNRRKLAKFQESK